MKKSATVNHIDFIELPAKSKATLNRCKSFYTDVFDWTYEDCGDDYSDIKGSGIGSGINADPAHQPANPMVVIYTDSLEKAHGQVLVAKGEITREPFSFPGGRRFHFKDPAGNELAVWSDK